MDKRFLPTNLDEGKEYYGSTFLVFDVVFVTGDPYYDHPLSGMAIIARLLDSKGYKVGIIPQPLQREDYTACGRPRFFFCITSGLLDSMLANYTPMLKKREGVLVPERALIVYTQQIKELFKGSMTVLGGVEATLRRFTHFDYKDNTLRKGILHDSKADLILFGNAERAILTLLEQMKPLHQSSSEMHFDTIKEGLDLGSIEGVTFRVKKDKLPKVRKLPSFEECVADPLKFNLLTRMTYLLPDGEFLEQTGVGWIWHTRPAHTLVEEEMDYLYGLSFTRQLHPATKNMKFNEQMIGKLRTSVVIGRGCWGSCTFCVIPLVQGKEVAKRSRQSIVKEIDTLYASGHSKINDLTLPTLNMYGSSCALYKHESTLFSPIIDKDISVYDKKDYCNQQCAGCQFRVLSDDLYPLLEEIEKLQQKHAGAQLELRSAIRHDIILDQKKLFRKIMQFTTRLKIAPEHLSDTVLKQMNKATAFAFKEFLKEYEIVNKEQGTNKNLVPYFVAAHPGSTMQTMEETKRFVDEHGLFVNLTQVFTPTPGTMSTAMYYSGENPITREKVHVPRTFREKKDQKNVLFRNEEKMDDEAG